MTNFIKNKKYWIVALVIISVAGGLYYYNNKTKTISPQYTTAQAQNGTIVQTVAASGMVTSSNYYNVNTQASGVVQKVLVHDGDLVSVGQALLNINLDQAGQQAQQKAYAAYLSAQTTFQDAQNNKGILQNNVDQVGFTAVQSKLNLSKALISAKQARDAAQTTLNHTIKDTKAYTQAKMSLAVANSALAVAQGQYDVAGTSADQIQTNVQTAQNKLADADSAISQAQANLQAASNAYNQTKSVVTSAVAGQVSGLSVFNGMSITVTGGSNSNSNSTSSTLLSITNQTNPIVSVNVAENDIPNIKIGESATITLDAFNDKSFTGKVVGINKAGTVSSGVTSYPVMIQFDTLPDSVLPNMSATTNIILQTAADVLMVPSASIKTATDGTNTVQIMVNGQVQSKTVQIGISDDTNTQITSGLNAGDTVVTGTVAATSSATTSTTSIFGGLRTGGNAGGFGGGSGAANRAGGSAGTRVGG